MQKLDPMMMFTRSLRSKETRKTYQKMLNWFMRDTGLESPDKLLESCSEELVIQYLIQMQEKGLSYSSRRTSLAAIKHFYEINDVTFKWKKIGRFLGENIKTIEDRGYTREEVKRLLDKCDERKRVIILTLASSGIRVGGLIRLKVRNIKRVSDLYQITVYEGTQEKYSTFCTPECAKAIDSYFDYRRRHGEKITPESPLIREQFDKESLAPPRHISDSVIRSTLQELLIDSGLREKPTEATAYKRKEIMTIHGFRKFFSTELNRATKNPLMRTSYYSMN